MELGRYLWLATLLMFATSMRVAAQPALPGNIWSHGTTINVFAGAASASSSTGALAGGAAGWEITPRFGLEGSAAWLDRPGRSEAFTAALTVLASVMRPQRAVPFVRGGIGLYRASFDPSRDAVPDFYRRRMAARSSALEVRQTFTDPSLVVGGGVNIFATRRWAIRPEVEAIIVRGQSRNQVVSTVTIHLAYHFEDHPVTAVRAGK